MSSFNWQDEFDAAFNPTPAPSPRLREDRLVLVWKRDEVFGRLYTTLVPESEAGKYERVVF